MADKPTNSVKRFIYSFDSGACLIKDWKIHNLLRQDRLTETLYKQELSTVTEDNNKSYIMGGGQMPAECPHSIVEYSIDKVSVVKDSIKEKEKFLCLVTDVVDYFNSVMKTRISIKGVVTNRNIKARSLEGYVLSDFMKVIDVKYEDWISDPKMSKNLNTDTLFGNKFEKYLNQKKSMTAVDSVFGESTIKDINSLEYKPF